MISLWVHSHIYADDLILLAPSPAALRRLMLICEQFGAANMLKFNLDVSNFHTVVLLVLVYFLFVWQVNLLC